MREPLAAAAAPRSDPPGAAKPSRMPRARPPHSHAAPTPRRPLPRRVRIRELPPAPLPTATAAAALALVVLIPLEQEGLTLIHSRLARSHLRLPLRNRRLRRPDHVHLEQHSSAST